MDRIVKILDQGVTGVTDKVITTVSNIKRDFTRRSKRRKQEKKEKKQKKMQQVDDVEHKYKLVCDIPNCEFHLKPNAYEDFLDTLWSPKSNRSSIHSSQIMMADETKKSNLSIENDKENVISDDKLDALKDRLSQFHNLKDLSSDDSSDSTDNLADILNTDSVKLTITNENGETTTVVGIEGLNSELPVQTGGKCMICFNKLKSPLEIMPCFHLFHKNCIIQWLEIKTTCPLCNQRINEHQIEKYKKRWSQ